MLVVANNPFQATDGASSKIFDTSSMDAVHQAKLLKNMGIRYSRIYHCRFKMFCISVCAMYHSATYYLARHLIWYIPKAAYIDPKGIGLILCVYVCIYIYARMHTHACTHERMHVHERLSKVSHSSSVLRRRHS